MKFSLKFAKPILNWILYNPIGEDVVMLTNYYPKIVAFIITFIISAILYDVCYIIYEIAENYSK